MARKKLAALAAPFQGRWRIAEMDLWDNEALDLVEPAFLEIKGQQGEMRFIAVQAWLDIRYDVRAGGPLAEFSWEGIDEGDLAAEAGGFERGGDTGDAGAEHADIGRHPHRRRARWPAHDASRGREFGLVRVHRRSGCCHPTHHTDYSS